MPGLHKADSKAFDNLFLFSPTTGIKDVTKINEQNQITSTYFIAGYIDWRCKEHNVLITFQLQLHVHSLPIKL